jgi:hypothetical protein
VSAPLCRDIGSWSCDFRPFEKREYQIGSIDIDRLNDEQLSTVYRGIRFYFETPEQLKAFCEMIEDHPTVEHTARLQKAVDDTIESIREIREDLDSLDKDTIDTRLYWLLSKIKN